MLENKNGCDIVCNALLTILTNRGLLTPLTHHTEVLKRDSSSQELHHGDKSSSSSQSKLQGSSFVGEGISIHPKIERSPTDILKVIISSFVHTMANDIKQESK